MSNNESQPWYKQFWPWFLIAIPVISIILSMTMMHLATSGKDSLVIDDYYKEGKGINLQLVKYQEARARGIQTSLTVHEDQIELRFDSGRPATGEALRLNFQHATLADRDFSVMLVQDAKGVYTGVPPASSAGKWRVTLQPVDEQWRITQTVSLPRRGAIPFNP